MALQHPSGDTGHRSGGKPQSLEASPPGDSLCPANSLVGVESTVPELRATGLYDLTGVIDSFEGFLHQENFDLVIVKF